MILCADVRNDQYQAIDRLIAAGKYRDVSEIVRVALDNQLVHEGVANLVLQEEGAGRQPLGSEDAGAEQAALRDLRPSIAVRQFPSSVVMPSDDVPTLPDISDERLIFEGAESRGPLWGQVNRLLPVKAALRVLASSVLDAGQSSVAIGAFHRALGEAGRSLGLILREADERASRRRSEWLATAFPIGEDESKSRDRYVGQFGIYVRRDGALDGALARLGYVNIDVGGKVGLTSQGLTWCLLRNPILDEGRLDPPAISTEEANAYLRWVKASFQDEFALMQRVVSLIRDSASRVDIDRDLGKRYGWTEAEAGTMRAGVIARLTELGVIEKQREGATTKYLISETNTFDLTG